MDRTQPVPADAFKLSLDRGRVVIEFGQGETAGGASAVTATDRVVMAVGTARRLLVGLEECLEQNAARLRSLAAQALPPEQAAVASRPGQASARPEADQSGDMAALLLRLVGELGAPHQYERSFRIGGRGLQANRFLLTLNVRDIQGDPRARVLAVCNRFNIPPALRAAAEAAFGMAHCLHFGFEGDAGGIVCKLYLERQVPADAAQARGERVLLHLAFKWDVLRGGAVTTRYFWHPFLTAPAIRDRLAALYGDAPDEARGIAEAMLDLGAARVDARRMQYLEVEEAENARRSFDLNLYNAGLQVRDALPLLQRMRAHFGVRPGQFQAVVDQIRGKALGHLAGGVHRDGGAFFNLYYGVVAVPQPKASPGERQG